MIYDIHCPTCDKIRRGDYPLHCLCGETITDGSRDQSLWQPDQSEKWVPESPCLNRGETLRQMEGQCCGGRQIVDVFECSVHGECTYRNTKAGKDKPQPCLGCVDHAIS